MASEPTRAEDYVPFLERAGTPALELACGAGRPLLDLVTWGYAVEGLDSSTDMLRRCRDRAVARGLDVTLHHAEMQAFSLGRRFRSIFLAGASFTLLTTDEEAGEALACMYDHLEPGGSVLIPLEQTDAKSSSFALGRARETTNEAGERLRVSLVEVGTEDAGRVLRRRLRYERIPASGEPEVLERDWRTRSWAPARFRDLMESAGFDHPRCTTLAGGPCAEDEPVFVARARRER